MKGDYYVVIACVEMTEKLILNINCVTSIIRCFIVIYSMNKFNNTIQENDNDDDHDEDDDDDDDDDDVITATTIRLPTIGQLHVV